VPLLDGVRALLDAPEREVVIADERAAWLVGLRQLADELKRFSLARWRPSMRTVMVSRCMLPVAPASWLRGALHLAAGDASSRVQVARGSSQHLQQPLVALAAGVVTFDQVQAIDKAVRRLPEPVHESAT